MTLSYSIRAVIAFPRLGIGDGNMSSVMVHCFKWCVIKILLSLCMYVSMHVYMCQGYRIIPLAVQRERGSNLYYTLFKQWTIIDDISPVSYPKPEKGDTAVHLSLLSSNICVHGTCVVCMCVYMPVSRMVYSYWMHWCKNLCVWNMCMYVCVCMLISRTRAGMHAYVCVEYVNECLYMPV